MQCFVELLRHFGAYISLKKLETLEGLWVSEAQVDGQTRARISLFFPGDTALQSDPFDCREDALVYAKELLERLDADKAVKLISREALRPGHLSEPAPVAPASPGRVTQVLMVTAVVSGEESAPLCVFTSSGDEKQAEAEFSAKAVNARRDYSLAGVDYHLAVKLVVAEDGTVLHCQRSQRPSFREAVGALFNP
jgi:hypothetical protein